MKGYLVATFASLGVRNYRLFFIGQSVSIIGTWMQKFALAWLMLELTNSGAWLGITLAVQMAPTLLLTPWGGVLADRFKKRTILICTAAASIVPSVLLGVLILAGSINVTMVMGLALLGGVIDAFEKPARQSFPSEMVGTAQLTNAVMLNNVSQDIGKVVGPAVAGILIAAAGLPSTFLINAASFVTVIAGLLLMRTDELTTPKRKATGAREFRDGLAYVRTTPQLLGPLALLASVGLVAYNFQVILPLLARDTFHGDARTAGYLLGAFGVGSVIGGLGLAGVLVASIRRIIVAALVLAVVFLAASLAPNYWVALGIVAALGASSIVFKALSSTWLQLTAAPAMRGRVLALLVVSIGGTTPIGAPLMGWVAQEFGTRATFVLGGVCTAIAAALAHLYMRRATADKEQVATVPAQRLTTTTVDDVV
jgi:MFS family permease